MLAFCKNYFYSIVNIFAITKCYQRNNNYLMKKIKKKILYIYLPFATHHLYEV